ncbi:metabotropic glutamate receptor 5-like isoform X2 [Portunus trituberculatus]|uniref:metabotropic glutamate receptor 5-like isoform X2 n=1 Tax=Portunus trituberculatus TaxID=210409 RepID=UPI001E1CCBC2|nr:metabotropic glutamate receptor 5-like isoform X2 [Portunus trituberculatus]
MAVRGGRRLGMESGERRGRRWVLLAWPVTLVVVTTLLCVTAATAANKQRKTALIEGDILIGALFSVHELPKQKTASTLTCGDIREQYGIQRVEAAFLAIDQINNNTELLPNIRLGVEIRDSCWYSSIALQQSLEFIRDALSAPGDATNTSTRTDSCRVASPKKRLVGVVGPGSSDVTIQVQNLLQLFSIPQVGYSATSTDLSIKSHYSYFMRVVPSDYYQAKVLLNIVLYYDWTYVSTIYTIGNYGQSGMMAFKKLAKENNVCPAKEESVRSDADEEAYDTVIRNLLGDQRAKVVVCFCEGLTITNLLKAVKRNNATSRFLFIGSDGWADRSDVVPAGLESVAEGGLSVKIQSSKVDEFDDYYFGLHPDTNTRNPWFKEFWQHRFNCSLSDTEEGGEKTCTKNESLAINYKQDTKMAFVMKAIYTMAWGLHNMHRALCQPGEGLCKAMLPINGSIYRDYLMNATFTYHDETVTFDDRGDPPGRYNIMNYQRGDNNTYIYKPVGSWDNGNFNLWESDIKFNTPGNLPPISVCSDPCRYDEFKSSSGEGTKTCCWVCTRCGTNQYLKNETACEDCEPGYKPNANKTGCDAIPVQHLTWDAPESIAALTLASLGFLATCFTMSVFIKYNHTPVVKASTRELSYIIFVGMMVSYCATLPLLAPPSSFSCAASRILPGLSFAMIYAALVTKTNRIARILAGNKKITMRKPRFMSATAQVVITCGLIGIELGIIIAMLILDVPDSNHHYPNEDEVILVCNTTDRAIIIPLAWDFFLILMCTVYAVKTRNLPENFNEAKFIGFSMYTTCVIWLAWFPIYFGSTHKIICMSMCTSLSALVTLVLLFFPKLYIILFRPEKNDRSAFKTAKTVRCHIGSSNKTSLSRPSDPTPSAAVESMYVGSAMLGLMPQQLSLMQRLKTSIGAVPFLPSIAAVNQRTALKREISVWSDASGSGGGGGGTAATTRDAMLRRAYGSQLDLTAEAWYGAVREERACQTTDELLDPLIPRLRRRVVRAVREHKLDAAEGREFFSLTHGWMSSQGSQAPSQASTKAQAEAARNEMRRGDTDSDKVAAAAAAVSTTTTTTTTTAATAAAAATSTSTTTSTTTTTTTTTTTRNATTSHSTSVPTTTTTSTTTTAITTSTSDTTTPTQPTTSIPAEHHTAAAIPTTIATTTTTLSTTASDTISATTVAASAPTIALISTTTTNTTTHEEQQDTTTTTITTTNTTADYHTQTNTSLPETTTTTINSTSQQASEAGHCLAISTSPPSATRQIVTTSTTLVGSQAASAGSRACEASEVEERCQAEEHVILTAVGGQYGEAAARCQRVADGTRTGTKEGDCRREGTSPRTHEDCPGQPGHCPQGQPPDGWFVQQCSFGSLECPETSGGGLEGYGSPLSCVDNGAPGWVTSPESPAPHSPLGEAVAEGAAWGSGEDYEKLLLEAKPKGARRVEVLGRREGRHRRRKVGVAARVADVRGILRCVAFPRTERPARVSFDMPELPHAGGPPRAPWPRRSSGSHGQQDASFRILEESDAEASDSCEMKTITIRLGDTSEGSGDSGTEGSTNGGGGTGGLINWRPRPGKNHQALACLPDQETAAARPAAQPSELVILDLLHDSRLKEQGPSPPSPPAEPSLDHIIIPPPRQYTPADSPHHLHHNHLHKEAASTTPTLSSSSSSSTGSPRGEATIVEASHRHHNHHHHQHHHHHHSPPSLHDTIPLHPLQVTTTTTTTAITIPTQVPEHEAHADPEAPPRHDTDDDTDDGSTTPIEEFFLNHGVRFDATSARSKKL